MGLSGPHRRPAEDGLRGRLGGLGHHEAFGGAERLGRGRRRIVRRCPRRSATGTNAGSDSAVRSRPAPPAWSATVGGMLAYLPEYEGSDEFEIRP